MSMNGYGNCAITVCLHRSILSLFSELKRRLKAEKKAQEKAEKVSTAVVEQTNTGTKEKEEDIDPNVSCLFFYSFYFKNLKHIHLK